MTTPAVPRLPPVLAQEPEWDLQLEDARTDVLKAAARFWFPPKPPTVRAACQAALIRLFSNPAEMAPRLTALPATERAILAVFKRYDGALSGTLLRTELLARSVIALPTTGDGYMPYSSSRNAHYAGLENKFLVAPRDGDPRSHYSYFSGNEYPDMVANPAALASITAAEPAPWQPVSSAPTPTAVTSTSFSEIVLNLWAVAQELSRNNWWKPTRARNMPKSLINKLRKVVPEVSSGPPSVPDLPGLYCQLLDGLGVLISTEEEVRINLDLLEKMLDTNTEALALVLARAWIYVKLWQDGTGTLDDRDAKYRLNSLHTMRELLAWGLGVLARVGDGWFDLESFLRELWNIHQKGTPYFYGCEYVWTPTFAPTQLKADVTGPDRFLTLWINGTGVWCANAILGTLVHLGLVERGPVTGRGPLAFRLTALGRIVFGSPDVPGLLPSTAESRFFTIQPNFEVIAYIDDVPTRVVWPLARLARRTSGSGNPVQTFVIDRESMYHAMEGGFTLNQIREYLTSHARNTPSPNVIRTLEEWGGKRESLVLRRGVSLLVGIDSPPKVARAVGDGFHLLDATVAVPKGLPLLTYPDRARPCGEASEDGVIRLDPDADLIAVARLQQLIGAADVGELRITEASVAGAKRRGLSAEQLLDRLRHHHRGPVPLILEVAIRNWSVGGQVVLGNLLMLRVPDSAIASAILGSERFKPFIIRHIPLQWFVVDGKHRKELERLLTSIGYTWTAEA